MSGGRWPGAAATGSGCGVRDGSGAGSGERGRRHIKKCEGLLPLPPHLASREEGEGGTRGHRGASGISSASVYRETSALKEESVPLLDLYSSGGEEKGKRRRIDRAGR